MILDVARRLAVGFGEDRPSAAMTVTRAPRTAVALGAFLQLVAPERAVEQGGEDVVEEPRLGDEGPLEPRDGLRLERAAHVDPHDEDAQPGHDSEEDGQSRGETEAALARAACVTSPRRTGSPRP